MRPTHFPSRVSGSGSTFLLTIIEAASLIEASTGRQSTAFDMTSRTSVLSVDSLSPPSSPLAPPEIRR